MRSQAFWIAAAVLLLGADGVDARDAAPANEPVVQPPAVKTVKLASRRDRVTLTDGTVLEGMIVAAGARAIVIVTPEGEKTVPKDNVERVERGVAGADALTLRTFEMEVVDGRERVAVPPGLGEETEELPPGITVGAAAGAPPIALRYKLAKGDTLQTLLDIATEKVEDLPGDKRTIAQERRKLRLTQTVADVAADGVWTVGTAYELLAFLRDNADVTELEGKGVGLLRHVRALSPAGLWQPAADNITSAEPAALRFARSVDYTTVPLPPKLVSPGWTAKLEEVVPPAVAAALLEPPPYVTVPGWGVSGQYVLQGTAEVDGVPCALISIRLEGKGEGEGAYGGKPAAVKVSAEADWDIEFAVAAGHPVRCSVSMTAQASGQIGEELMKSAYRLVVNAETRKVGAAGAIAPPPLPQPQPQPVPPDKPGPEKAAEPQKPIDNADLDRDLDDLMKRLRDPKFFEEKK